MNTQSHIYNYSFVIKFLVKGGFKAAFNAFIGGLGLFFVHVTSQEILKIFKQGFQIPALSWSDVISILFPDLISILLIGLFSFIPAFLGGILLAWWVRHEYIKYQKNSWKLFGKGSLVGAITGAILALLILIPSYMFNKAAPSGIDFDPITEISKYILFAGEIAIIAAFTGSWTDKQLRKDLSVATQ